MPALFRAVVAIMKIGDFKMFMTLQQLINKTEKHSGDL